MHIHTIRVYFSHTDCGGIVYHGKYLDFIEHARTELLREVGKKTSQADSQSVLMEHEAMLLVVKSISIEYQSPAYLDDLLTVETELESAKRFSLVFRQTVKRGEQSLCSALVKVAAIDQESMRPKPIPVWFAPAITTL